MRTSSKRFTWYNKEDYTTYLKLMIAYRMYLKRIEDGK
jgi:hypothetical protein